MIRFLTAALIGLVLESQGATYYASPTGVQGNTGTTPSSPWPLTYSLTQVSANDSLILLSGTYPAIDLADTVRHVGLQLRSQTKWGARILGTTSTNMHGIATEVGVSNVIIDGFEIAYPWISGVKLNDHYSSISNCWIHHAAKGNPAWQYNTNDTFEGSGIEAHNKLNTVIERNLIEYCGAWSNHDHGIYYNGTNGVIRNNVLRYNLAHAVQVFESSPQAASNLKIYNNLAYGNGRGIVLYTQTGCTNYVYGNTIISTNAAVESTPILIRRSPYVSVTNNICLGTGFSIGTDDGTTPITEDYNIVSTSVGGPHDIVNATPGFLNPSKGLYWLQSGALARNAALGSASGPVDFFGNTQASVTDIGAFQYSFNQASDTRTLDPSGAGADYWGVVVPGTVSSTTINVGVLHLGGAP